jgi:hypothetical protein
VYTSEMFSLKRLFVPLSVLWRTAQRIVLHVLIVFHNNIIFTRHGIFTKETGEGTLSLHNVPSAMVLLNNA